MIAKLVIVANMLKHPDSLAGVNESGLADAAFFYLPFGGNQFLSLALAACFREYPVMPPKMARGIRACSKMTSTEPARTSLLINSSEAGIGTSAIPAAASGAKSPSRQAYVSMTAVFWDCVVQPTPKAAHTVQKA